MTSGKSYTFAWRFANSKGVQQTYSLASPLVTLKAPGNPEPPRHLHVGVVEDSLFVRWRMTQSGGRPVIKFNIRVSDLTGTVLFEKASYQPHIAFHHLTVTDNIKVEVNAMTSAGISQWSQPFIYSKSSRSFVNASFVEPAVSVMSVDAHDVIATIHLNATAPGTVMCSYYSPTVRPLFEQRPIRHAGHAHLHLKDLQEEMTYTVECSLNVNDVTVQSEKATFTTQAHTTSHLSVNDLETYSTFARVTLKSETPGEVLCMHRPRHPHHRRHHHSSAHTFQRFAKRLFVGVLHSVHV